MLQGLRKQNTQKQKKRKKNVSLNLCNKKGIQKKVPSAMPINYVRKARGITTI